MSSGSPRILILEDDFIVGEDLRRMVRDLGFDTIGPISGIAPALAVVRDVPVDAALLDVHIDDGLSFEIADALDAAEIPYAFVTGLQRLVLREPRFSTRLVISKPVRPQAIADVLRGWGLWRE